MRKVTLFVNGFPDRARPSYGIFNRRVATELSKHVDLTIVVPMALRPGRKLVWEEECEGIPVIRVSAPMVPGLAKLNLRLFRAFLQKPLHPCLQRADIVHSVGVEFAGLLAGELGRRHQYCHVTQIINNLFCLRGVDFATYPFMETLGSSVGGIICNSRSLEAAARRFFPRTALVRTIYRGTDLALFSPDAVPAGIFPERDGVKFLFLGGVPGYADRIYGRNTKGGLTLMEAWTRSEDDLDRLGATLFFGGPDADIRRVLKWRDALKHPRNVRLGGMVPPGDVPGHVRAADVVLVPSLEEGCPNIVFESCASGRAVVGSDIDSLTELIGDGDCGFTAKAGDPVAWAEALVRLAHPEARSEIRARGAAARKKAERLFDHRDYARNLLTIYGEASGRSG